MRRNEFDAKKDENSINEILKFWIWNFEFNKWGKPYVVALNFVF